MREKRKAYIGQDVYIGRPGRLPDVECCHLVFCMVVYNSNTPPQTYQNTELIREKLSSVK
jgi:hypothetical protein